MSMHGVRGQRGPGGCRGRGWRAYRIAGLVLFALLATTACSKANHTQTPPAIITTSLSPTPSVTVTATASATPSRSPSPTPSAHPSVSVTATPSPAATIQIKSTSGATLPVTKGTVLTLTLQQAFDGGYTWQFTTQPDSTILAVVNQQNLPATPAPVTGTVGGSNLYRATFKAVGAGTTSFTLNEERTGSSPIMTYSLTVTVSSP
jgi:predicted secreted protein